MYSKLVVLLTGVVLVAACAKHRTEPVHIRCEKGIKQANQLLHKHSNNYDKAMKTRLQNLIKSAKIQQQHEQYIGCNDNAYRAIELMEPNRKK